VNAEKYLLDKGLIGGRWFDDIQVAGYPVASSRVLSLDPEYKFLGVSYNWDELFAGFDFRYFSQGTLFYGLLDYDTFSHNLMTF